MRFKEMFRLLIAYLVPDSRSLITVFEKVFVFSSFGNWIQKHKRFK